MKDFCSNCPSPHQCAEGGECAGPENFRPSPREVVAMWMLKHGLATGHGDTLEDLLSETAGHVEERQAKFLALAAQYRNDLLHPLADDSRKRRLEWIATMTNGKVK